MSNIREPLVSILTPVYNGEAYLQECIESVLKQTHRNWVYTIVNNCSTDRSLEIAQGYAEKDSRISIHNNQKHVGVIENHNIAFRQIHPESKYCKFALADDLLFPDCIMQMVKIAEEYPSVGIVCSYSLGGNEVIWDGLPYPSTFLSGREICRATLLQIVPYVFGSPTSQLFRSDLVREDQTIYDESNLHADNEACYKLLQHSDFGFVHQVLSFTRRDNESVGSYSARMESYILGRLTVLFKYGNIYLSGSEYKYILDIRLDGYYKLLAYKKLQMTEKEFWDFHKNRMKDLGHPISRNKLLKYVILEVLRKIGNPGGGVKRVVEWGQRGLSRIFKI